MTPKFFSLNVEKKRWSVVLLLFVVSYLQYCHYCTRIHFFYRNYFDAGKILIFSRNFCKQMTWINLAGALVFIIGIYYMGLSCFQFYVCNKNKLDFSRFNSVSSIKTYLIKSVGFNNRSWVKRD